ncbi:hypothetical protein BKA58DRAFT_4905 [Alternaria rosae]|uniref:uncharacterized protein n=1 Tax=Alternaria rosae TaxID=1187941 RepID=UPI001E8D8DCE|nr:uncharacterized protein BKA58DRAFT_4905 [Alternaria rosae]KAH6881563.1 hypothetical protein BKA58DRAFT_4905 [Alternaria rosae]
MEPPPSPLYLNSNAKGKNKRAVEDGSTIIGRLQDLPTTESNAPNVVRRRQHRRHNIAAEIWGPDIPSGPTPQTSTGGPAPKQRFSVYKAIIRHPNLFFQFALRLPCPSIVDLYAIDKEFHYRLNLYSVSLIHDYARYHAPLAGHIFSWVLYPRTCISDPMLRPMDGREWLARDVPGFRWVGMIIYRQKVVRSILTYLALEGHRVPEGCEGALMKYWCVMELNESRTRRSFLEDADIWTDTDLINIQLFFMKLDMRFSDPILGNGVCQLGPMLLAQKSLTPLWEALSGKLKFNYDTTSAMVVATYLMDDLDFEAHPWLEDIEDHSVPEEQWGLLSLEGWNEDGKRMPHALDLVITESIRRGLDVQQYYLDFVMYGYGDSKTGENIPVPVHLRGDKKVRVPSEGWPSKEMRQSTIKKLDARFWSKKAAAGDAMDLSA